MTENNYFCLNILFCSRSRSWSSCFTWAWQRPPVALWACLCSASPASPGPGTGSSPWPSGCWAWSSSTSWSGRCSLSLQPELPWSDSFRLCSPTQSRYLQSSLYATTENYSRWSCSGWCPPGQTCWGRASFSSLWSPSHLKSSSTLSFAPSPVRRSVTN